MLKATVENPNISYQYAPGVKGGSYTENKLQLLNLPPLKGRSFLDLGCNTGFYCNFAKRAGAERTVGVDLDSAVIARARELYPEIEFFDTGWDVLPDGKFDVIICLSAIHYASDPIKLVNNIKTHLSRDGVFVVEGGLIDVAGKFKTDILIPGWRKVGDRCRHLSRGFVDGHLLREFDWKVVGPSEPRGGDNVPRYVVHATQSPSALSDAFEENRYHLDLVEYFEGLALSAETIVPSMPSFNYVSRLGQYSKITSAEVESVLSSDRDFPIFVDDLLFAIGDGGPVNLTLHRTVPEPSLEKLADALCQRVETIQYSDESVL
jgi:SAM-dependent methyltransferase